MESLWERETRLQASVSAIRHVLNDATGSSRERLTDELTRAENALYAFYEETGHIIIRRNIHVQQGADIRSVAESDTVHSQAREHGEGDECDERIVGRTNNHTNGGATGGND